MLTSIRRGLTRLAYALVDGPIRLVDRRMTEHAVREYHRSEWRRYRVAAVSEPDPRLQAWFQRQAAAHRQFCA